MNDILKEVYKQRPELDVRGNDSLLLDVAVSKYGLTHVGLTQAAHLLEAQGALVIHPTYASAWAEFKLLNPDKDTIAHRRELFAKMRDRESKAAEKHEYNSFIKELGREDLRGIPVEDLRKMVAVKRENDRRRALSRSELNQLAKQETPAPTRGSLPPTWYGADISTPEALKALWQRNFQSFQALCGRYGAAEVNRFMGAVPTPKVGISVNLEELSQGLAPKALPANITKEALHSMSSPELRKLVRQFGASAINDVLFSRN